ncbi:MAG: ROK family protein [Deltaproteobacteria bacterium]|nr:ROK family protein [Deltaproteobacteria bacterium]
MGMIALAVDLGGTNIRVAAIDEGGTIRKRFTRPTVVAEGKEAVLARLFLALEEVSRSFAEEQVQGVGLGCAGVIQIERGIISQSPNFPGWENVPIKERIQACLSRSVPVLVDNDANAAAMGEVWQGSAMNSKHVVCLTLGTGIGGGLVVDGNLVHGADGMAGELGHIIVDPQGPQCNCGNHGCLEAFASGTAIKREAIKIVRDYPAGELNKRCNGNPEAITAEMVCQSAVSGDLVCRRIYETMGRYLGIGIASLINVFNPEIVVIGGRVSRAWDLFISHTKEEIAQRAFKLPAQRAKVVPAARGDDAGLLGAAFLVFRAIR